MTTSIGSAAVITIGVTAGAPGLLTIASALTVSAVTAGISGALIGKIIDGYYEIADLAGSLLKNTSLPPQSQSGSVAIRHYFAQMKRESEFATVIKLLLRTHSNQQQRRFLKPDTFYSHNRL